MADIRTLARLIHREMVQLAVLGAIAIMAFLGTRSLAAASRRLGSAEAAEWFRRGQAALAAGRPADAAESFRRAAVRRRNDRGYVLALAGALRASGDADAAWRELLALRESAPDDPDVNTELARIAVVRRDATSARRFYDNALYAPWPPARAQERRALRIEFIRFLLDRADRGRALAELVALSPTLPPDAPTQAEVGGLYASAGDDRRALEHYRQALARDPRNQDALAGAGLAAFRLRDYKAASTYLARTSASSGDLSVSREVALAVLANDPLAPRLGAVERRRRLDSALVRVHERLASCPAAADVGSPTHDVEQFRADMASGPLDQDGVEAGLDLVHRASAYADAHCAPPIPLDRALDLIADLHQDSRR